MGGGHCPSGIALPSALPTSEGAAPSFQRGSCKPCCSPDLSFLQASAALPTLSPPLDPGRPVVLARLDGAHLPVCLLPPWTLQTTHCPCPPCCPGSKARPPGWPEWPPPSLPCPLALLFSEHTKLLWHSAHPRGQRVLPRDGARHRPPRRDGYVSRGDKEVMSGSERNRVEVSVAPVEWGCASPVVGGGAVSRASAVSVGQFWPLWMGVLHHVEVPR